MGAILKKKFFFGGLRSLAIMIFFPLSSAAALHFEIFTKTRIQLFKAEPKARLFTLPYKTYINPTETV